MYDSRAITCMITACSIISVLKQEHHACFVRGVLGLSIKDLQHIGRHGKPSSRIACFGQPSVCPRACEVNMFVLKNKYCTGAHLPVLDSASFIFCSSSGVRASFAMWAGYVTWSLNEPTTEYTRCGTSCTSRSG